jgi:hypothetical protein
VTIKKKKKREKWVVVRDTTGGGQKICKTIKNIAFWDIKTQFIPQRRHITSPLQSPAS